MKKSLALVLAVSAGPALSDGVTVSHGISAFGELKYPADFPHFDYVNPDAPQGGTMSFRGQLASQTFDSLNWFILKGDPAQGLELIYDELLVRAYDEPDAVYGQVAETLEYPEDRSWVIFNLRPEARFSDGHPIEASDIKFTLETLKAEARPVFRFQVDDVDTVEVLGPHRVKVTFAEDAATRDMIASVGEMPILPEHYYAEVAFDESTLDPPVGSGEYIVTEANPGRSITYCKNPDYWGKDLPVNVGEDNFDCVRYEYFADRTAAFEAFKAGEFLFHEEYSSALWATNYEFPSLENGWVLRDVISDGRPSGAQGFWLNMRRPILQDPRVRQALGMMFNFEWSNETLFYGLYRRTDSFFEGSDLQAEGLPGPEELAILEPLRERVPPEVFTEPAFSPNVSSTRQVDRAAVREASALLEAAGWAVGDDGIRRNADGDPLVLEFVHDSPGFERIILPYVSNLKRIGVDARNMLIDPAQMEERQDRFDFDIAIARLVPTANPSIELRTIFASESADQPGAFNLAGIEDEAVDELIELAIAAETRAELKVRLQALDRVMRAKHVWVPNWNKGEHWLAYWDVFGRPDVKPPYIRGDRYWWFDAAKYEALKEAGALR